MGSYLSRANPGLPSPTLSDWDLPSRPGRLGPSLFPRRVPLAFRVHSVAPSLNVTRRLSYEDLVASPRRQHRRQLVVHHRQRYPSQQARCLFLRVFPSASSEENKPLLSVSSSRMSCPSGIMKLASAKGKLTLRLALQQSVLTIWSSLVGHFSIPYAKKSSMRPLEESSQVKAKEEKDLTTLGGERIGKEEDHHTVPERQDVQKRGSEASEAVQSAFRCLLVNGAFSSFVPRPGPLKRDFCYKSSANSLIRKSKTSIMSCNKRNAITSSYSSTQGFQLPQERNGASTAGFPHSASSHFQAPANKASEEGHQASPLASVVPQKQIKHEKSVEVPLDKQQNLRIRSPSCDLSGPKKRKIPLLLPYRKNEPLILPPPLELGYPVTAEVLDLEKRAAIQWINKVLKGKWRPFRLQCCSAFLFFHSSCCRNFLH
uniref:Nuclear envelope pore membrane protein POM 121 n=1 Tax=Sciurus vulgaris TaxID=55149 RepID=A0A8D2AZH6_SCIVU